MSDKTEYVKLYLQDRYLLRSNTWTSITVFLTRWVWHGPRVKVTFVEGIHETFDDAQKAIRARAKEQGFPEDYPKHFEFVCPPEILKSLGDEIIKICT